MLKTIFKAFVLFPTFLVNICCAADTNACHSNFKDIKNDDIYPNLRNNCIVLNLIPISYTRLGYEHIFIHHYSIGMDWNYYYPTTIKGYNSYGFDNDDDQGIYNDINNSYYKIGATNRLDGFIKASADEGILHGFIKFFISYTQAKNFSQIYFNEPQHNAPNSVPQDSSVTQFLAANSNNKVYYRQESFNAWGWGIGLGYSLYFDKPHHFSAGIEFGYEDAYIPSSAKLPIVINNETYYYQYTPAWEWRVDLYLYGHVTLSYAF